MKKIFIALAAVLLSFSTTDASAQLLRNIGQSIVNSIKNSAQNRQRKAANDSNNGGEQQQPQQQCGELFSPAELPPLQTPATTYQYKPGDPTTGEHWDHGWVDLGLPSGVRWSDNGYRDWAYMWGKKSTDAEYCIGNCRSYGKDIGQDIAGNDLYDYGGSVMGRGWRMPRVEDIQELLENCDREYTTQNGQNGLKFTSRINGQSIFFSASGYKEGWNHNYKDEGYYWLATSGPDNYTAHVFKFSSNDNGTIMLAQRFLGCRIYPVMDRPKVVARQTKGNVGGHDWVDLGLPSSTRWATCNVGATKPSQRGNHYAWGETQTKSSYTEANSKFHNERNSIDIQGTAYDAAHVHWGNGWTMPTYNQIYELIHHCDWDYIQLDGRWVVKLTSEINGEVIYLPTNGLKDGTGHRNANGCGNYWASTPTPYNGAHGYAYGAAGGAMAGGSRYYGMGIRPVLNKENRLVGPDSGEHNGHKYIDLALPSGTMWATCNLGAKYTDDEGDYYSWGEITTINQTEEHKNELTGHNVPNICGNPQYDAATANWGDGWQTPTLEQFNELIEHCTWEFTNHGNRNGYKVISKENGNWIFLMCAGECGDNFHDPYQRPQGVNIRAAFWSSTNNEGSSFSCALKFSAKFTSIYTDLMAHRITAYNIRPVYVPTR